jgi:hypothetical protein
MPGWRTASTIDACAGITNRHHRYQPAQRQWQGQQHWQQAEGDEAGLPVPTADGPTGDQRQYDRRQPGTAENDRQGEAAVLLEPQVDQVRPGDLQGPDTGQGHQEETQVEHPDRAVNARQHEQAQAQHDQRH